MLQNNGRTQFIDHTLLKALIFDVDGTLYRQSPVRRSMLFRLLRAHLGRPAQGLSTLRALRAYRKSQEELRAARDGVDDIGEAQLRLACERTKLNSEFMQSCVARWMEEEPLDLLARALRQDLVELLRAAKRRGLRLGVFSDYPFTAKLAAMEVATFFDVAVSAQDPEVQRFKPNPRGLAVTLRRLGVTEKEALYIGDRPEVDAAAAARAGMKCVIVGGKQRQRDGREWLPVAGYRELIAALRLGES